MQNSPTVADAVKAERDRIIAINALPEAKGRETLAMTLATTTGLSVAQVKTALAAAPITGVGANVSAMWDAVLQSKGMTTDAKARQAVGEGAASPWDAALKSRGMLVS